MGQDVMNGLNPGQMVIKIVNEELVALMGSETTEIALQPQNEMTVIMMVGLQGAGKTTTTAKLAGKLKCKGQKATCWWPVTFTVRQRSSSCRSTVRSRAWKCSPWETSTDPVDIAEGGCGTCEEERI